MLVNGTWNKVQAQDNGVQFVEGTWAEVLAQAKTANKLIFVDAYATWCGPCKWMSKEVFTQEAVGTYFNTHFIAYKMDMEKGEGPDFAKLNAVEAYPTLLYFSPDGELLHRAAGARDVDDLLALSEAAMDPEQQLSGFVKRYEAGTKDKAFLTAYVDVLTNAGVEMEAVFFELWEQLTDEERQTTETLQLMYYASQQFRSYKDPLFAYLCEHQDKYGELMGAGTIKEVQRSTYVNGVYQIAQLEDKEQIAADSKHLLSLLPAYKRQFKRQLRYFQYAIKLAPSDHKVQQAYKRYLNVTKDAQDLHEAAWKICQQSDKPRELKKALKLVERSIASERNYINLDTKAVILYKMEAYRSAKDVAERAIEEGKALGLDEELDGTRRLLDKIEVALNN